MRAVHWNALVGVLFVLSFCRRLLSLSLLFSRAFLFSLFLVSSWFSPCQSPSVKRWVRVAFRGGVLLVLTRVVGPACCFLFYFFFSLCLPFAVDLCVRFGSCFPFPLSAVGFLGWLRVSFSLSLSSARVCVGAPCKSLDIGSNLL